MIPKFLTAIAVALTLTSCFRTIREERSLSDVAYLSFPRLQSPADVELLRDGEAGTAFKVQTGSIRYEVPAGTWHIKVSRDGLVLMERRLFISAGETRSLDVR